MRIIIQRVLKASLSSGGQPVSSINEGLFVLYGITHGDYEVDIDYLVPKILKTKLWDEWKMGVVDKGF